MKPIIKKETTERESDYRLEFSDIVKRVIEEADVILEVLDARFIDNTRNKKLENEIKKLGKSLIFVINKIDLVDKSEIKKTKQKLDLENIKPYVLFSPKERRGKSGLKDMIHIEGKKITKDEIAVGVIGYPNTGKSSIINYLTGKGSAKTSPKAGFTRGIQKIRLSKEIVLLDTPGVIALEKYSHQIPSKIAEHGKIGARSYNEVKDPEFIIDKIMKEYPGILEKYYNIQANGDSEKLIEDLGRRKGFLKKGNEVDTDRTARYILKEWQEGKIKISS
jgi:ribosome biogenesis GTPase A